MRVPWNGHGRSKLSQVKLLLPKFHRAYSALRSQATGGVGVLYVRLLLHRRSAAGWAECMIYSALVSFFYSLYSAGRLRAMSASALARAWPASVSFFPAALALAKARSPIKAAHHF